MKLAELIAREYLSDEIVLQDDQSALSTGFFIEHLARCRNQLAALDPPGPVGLLADNGFDWIIADLTCQELDRTILPLPTFFTARQLQHALDSTGTNLLFAQGKLPTAFTHFDYRGPVAGTDLSCFQRRRLCSPVSLPKNTGKITFTSGSTGTPKGVCLSHAQQIHQAQALSQIVNIETPRHLCLLPLSTLLENIAGIYAPLLSHGQVIAPSLSEMGFSGSALTAPRRLLNSISRHQPDSLILVPQLLQVLVGAGESGWPVPENLKFIAVGGSRVAGDLLLRAERLGLPVYEGYGLSECCSVVSLNTPHNRKRGTAGKPLPHLDVRIDNGDVVIRGNSMLGYVGQVTSCFQDEIRSGDLGNFDSDGYLTISGRRKNIIINSMGRNVSPEWVESELLANTGIAEAVVLGDNRPYCVALLTLRDPALSERNLTDWVRRVNDGLPDYARIRQWLVLPRLLQEEEGLVTGNGRPRRDVINEKFTTEITELYRQRVVA